MEASYISTKEQAKLNAWCSSAEKDLHCLEIDPTSNSVAPVQMSDPHVLMLRASKLDYQRQISLLIRQYLDFS